MRIAVYSDIHGNTPGMNAVHERIDAIGGFDEEICLGDVLYGGPGTRDIIRRLQDRQVVLVRGNHHEDLVGFDEVLSTLPSTHRRAAAVWHRWLSARVTEDDAAYLSSTPLSRQTVLSDGSVKGHDIPRCQGGCAVHRTLA